MMLSILRRLRAVDIRVWLALSIAAWVAVLLIGCGSDSTLDDGSSKPDPDATGEQLISAQQLLLNAEFRVEKVVLQTECLTFSLPRRFVLTLWQDGAVWIALNDDDDILIGNLGGKDNSISATSDEWFFLATFDRSLNLSGTFNGLAGCMPVIGFTATPDGGEVEPTQ